MISEQLIKESEKKLNKAFEYAEKVINEASKGVTEIAKGNENQIEEINLEDAFAK